MLPPNSFVPGDPGRRPVWLAPPPVTLARALYDSFAVLGQRYTLILAPYLLVVGALTAILLLGGSLLPEVGPLLGLAVFAVLFGAAVSLTAASIAAHRIAGATLVGDPDRHLDGASIGDTLHEVTAAHDRILPVIGLNVVLVFLAVLSLPLMLVVALVPLLAILATPFALYVLMRLSLAKPIVIMGESNPIRAIARSWRMTRGHFWTVFGFGVILLVAGLLIRGLGTGAGTVLGEGVGLAMDLGTYVLWLPVGPAATMALWALLHRHHERGARWRSERASPGRASSFPPPTPV